MALFSLVLCLLASSIILTRARADPPAFYQSVEFDKGELDLCPALDFHSSSLKAPRLNIQKWGPECDSDQKYLFCPRGLFVGPVGPVIMDSHGRMLWHREDFGVAYGLHVQRYNGQDVLTFWSGDDTIMGHGQGFYYMFDSSYRQLHRVSAIGHDFMADLHEFKITKDNTALLTVYQTVSADMTYYGPSYHQKNYVWDCLFQEINLETKQLLFEWRASDHFSFDDCYHAPDPKTNDGNPENPFDWFHINSVDKDDAGDYIISSRYSHAVTKISGQTGDILWHLGGKNNSFVDLSGGNATNFAWQHDARWHDNFRTISIFDNSAYFGPDKRPSRGILVAVDTLAMTASLIQQYLHPQQYISESQGSVQVMPNGHVLVGYGSAPALTEYAPNGTILCDAAFGALHWADNNTFHDGAVMSYRTYRQPWRGWPVENPHVAFQNNSFFVSWNGATEVSLWRLEGAADASNWSVIADFPWSGFESNCSLDIGLDSPYTHLAYRLTALDTAGAQLGRWQIDTSGAVVALDRPQQPPSDDGPATSSSRALQYVAVLVVGSALGAAFVGLGGIGMLLRLWRVGVGDRGGYRPLADGLEWKGDVDVEGVGVERGRSTSRAGG